MNKRISLPMAENAVEVAKECDVGVLTSFILGYPGETREDMDATISFAIRLDPDYAQFTILTPSSRNTHISRVEREGSARHRELG